MTQMLVDIRFSDHVIHRSHSGWHKNARLVNLVPFLFYPSLHLHTCTNLTRQNVRPTLAPCSKSSN